MLWCDLFSVAMPFVRVIFFPLFVDSVLQISVESWCWIEIETWRGAAKMRLSLRELSQELNNVLRTKCLIQNEGKPKTVDMKIILYFHTRTDNFIKNVLLLASFWKWGFLELGNDLFLVRFVFGGLQRSQRLYLFFWQSSRWWCE